MELLVGIDSWIIQDGNYPDFQVGEQYRTAFEFYQPQLSPVPSGCPSLTPLTNEFYVVSAAVAFASPDLFVIDAGVKLFTETPPTSPYPVGTFLSGSVGIGIDPFDYFEGVLENPHWPNLFYTWRLKEIRLITTPWVVSRDDHDVPTARRPPGPYTFRTIDRTDAQHDSDGNAGYVFLCHDIRLAV